MLSLRDIVKDYGTGDTIVHALKKVSIDFRENEFVSILGQSGCGKTTLLNIVGGLDRYTSGDLVIKGRSTKDYGDADWDAYRNGSIGFVFQSYNLIPHQSVIANVELALTLSGIDKATRNQRAKDALIKVGLEKEMNKKPNQLSGGQMQRVAIARAIVNNPSVILADEPTGALDSKTSVQVMEILREIARDRLVIMVTHNKTLAEEYSTRIITMMDGEVLDDNNPYDSPEYKEYQARVQAQQKEIESEAEKIRAAGGTDEKARKVAEKASEKARRKAERELTKKNHAHLNRTGMGFFTAMSLSWHNLVSKKGRTIMIALAGSIGIIGIALVLSLSNGFTLYINNMQTEMLSAYPVTVTQVAADTSKLMEGGITVKREEFPDGNRLVINTAQPTLIHPNQLTKEYEEYVDKIDKSYITDIVKSYGFKLNILGDTGTGYAPISTAGGTLDSLGGSSNVTDSVMAMMGMSSSSFNQLMNNSDYVKDKYTVLEGGKFPTEKDEIALVVDKYNSIDKSTLDELGIQLENYENVTFEDVYGKELKLIHNDEWFVSTKNPEDSSREYKQFNQYSALNTTDPETYDYESLYNNKNNLTLKVVGIIRIKDSNTLSMYSKGLVYTPALTEYVLNNSIKSLISRTQLADPSYNYLFGMPFMDMTIQGMAYTKAQQQSAVNFGIGAIDTASGYSIYPIDFNTKSKINAYLDKFNDGKTDDDKVLYTDASALISDSMTNLVDIISYVLVGFAAISLVVSSVMIGIITYTSVIERTKEIGVLRAVGARKKDIHRVFNAETFIIGLAAGLIGVVISFILTFPLSAIIKVVAAGMVTTSLAVMAWWHALGLIAISVALTLIAGLIPAGIAGKKDPVVALRSE